MQLCDAMASVAGQCGLGNLLCLSHML